MSRPLLLRDETGDAWAHCGGSSAHNAPAARRARRSGLSPLLERRSRMSGGLATKAARSPSPLSVHSAAAPIAAAAACAQRLLATPFTAWLRSRASAAAARDGPGSGNRESGNCLGYNFVLPFDRNT